jgi:hypothetical protein
MNELQHDRLAFFQKLAECIIASISMGILLALGSACGAVQSTGNGTEGKDAGDSDAAKSGDAGCAVAPWALGEKPEPSWATGCPEGGCPSGTACVGAGVADTVIAVGCAPIPASCGGTPSCECMGCVCGGPAPPVGGCGGGAGVTPDGTKLALSCNTGTVSLRSAKADIVYVGDGEREALAREALAIPLARYRYKNESEDARRRLGFIIDDQPEPSPAVDGDRSHVDLYGYASMMLAAVQTQAKELEELRERVRRLGSAGGQGGGPPQQEVESDRCE